MRQGRKYAWRRKNHRRILTFWDRLQKPFNAYSSKAGSSIRSLAGCWRPESPIYELFADTLRALLPMLVKSGIASEEDVGIETLAERLRAEIVSRQGVARSPALVSAWTRIEAP